MPGFINRVGLRKVWHRLRRQVLLWKYPTVVWGAKSRVQGWPRIWMHPTAQIMLGENVLLNSSPRGYHAGLAFPVTLIADRPQASITIGADSRLHGCCLHAWSSITIGKRCLFASGSQVLDAHGHDNRLEYTLRRLDTPDEPQAVTIEDDCWIGLTAILLKGVHLSRGSIVAAGSVVLAGKYPAYSLLAGNPARVVKTIPIELVLPPV